MGIAAHKEILVRFGYIGPQRWEQVKERNVRLSGKKTSICLRQIDIVVVPRHTPTIDLVTRRKGYDDQPSTVRTGQIVDSRQRFERNILGPDRNLRVGKLRPERVGDESAARHEIYRQVLHPQKGRDEPEHRETAKPLLQDGCLRTRVRHRVRSVYEPLRDSLLQVLLIEDSGTVNEELLPETELSVSEVITVVHDDDHEARLEIDTFLGEEQLNIGEAVSTYSEVKHLPLRGKAFLEYAPPAPRPPRSVGLVAVEWIQGDPQ